MALECLERAGSACLRNRDAGLASASEAEDPRRIRSQVHGTKSERQLQLVVAWEMPRKLGDLNAVALLHPLGSPGAMAEHPGLLDVIEAEQDELSARTGAGDGCERCHDLTAVSVEPGEVAPSESVLGHPLTEDAERSKLWDGHERATPELRRSHRGPDWRAVLGLPRLVAPGAKPGGSNRRQIVEPLCHTPNTSGPTGAETAGYQGRFCRRAPWIRRLLPSVRLLPVSSDPGHLLRSRACSVEARSTPTLVAEINRISAPGEELSGFLLGPLGKAGECVGQDPITVIGCMLVAQRSGL
jgi:hypothetical protein